MPDSPPTASSTAVATSAWDTLHSSIPVSYQVAIALDAFILFMTFAVLLLLALYIRKQIKLRHQNEDVEMKGSPSRSTSNGSSISTPQETTGTKRSMLGKFTRKKGHVRWTSSVEQCSDSADKGERERVKMKLGSGEWETDTWGSKSNAKTNADDEKLDIGMRGGGNAKSFRLSGIGGGESSGGIGEWQRGSLWKNVEARRELKKTKATKVNERAAAGYDGYRGN